MEKDFIVILGKLILPSILTSLHKTLMGFCYIAYIYAVLGMVGLSIINILKYEHKSVSFFARIYCVIVLSITLCYVYVVYALVIPKELVSQYGGLQAYAKETALQHIVIPYLFGIMLGLMIWFVFLRYILLFIERMINKISRSNFNVIKNTEDIYKERLNLGVKLYDPRDYFRIKEGLVFLGWNAELNEPIYDEYNTFVKKHTQSCGRSQTGKNLALQPLVVQMLQYGSFVLFFDVKQGGDDVMSPVLHQAAIDLNVPYTYMEFGMDAPAQINILESKDVDTLYEILIQLCNLQQTSDMGTDFYQQQARKIIFNIAKFVATSETPVTITEIIKVFNFMFFQQKIKDENKTKVQTTLEMFAEWSCINSKDPDTPTMQSLIENGGVLYIQAKTDVAYVIIQSIIAIIQKLQNKPRKITIVADEFFKYINSNMIQIFTEGGGKGIQCFVAYQTASLLKAPHLNITSQDMIGTLFANCSYSYIYGSNDPFIFAQIEKTSGTVKVNVESKTTAKNFAMIDQQSKEVSYNSQLAPKVTADMLNLLKDCENYLIFSGKPTYLTHIGHIPVMKGKFDKDSEEFQQKLKSSRVLTYSFKIESYGYDTLLDAADNDAGGYNPFD